MELEQLIAIDGTVLTVKLGWRLHVDNYKPAEDKSKDWGIVVVGDTHEEIITKFWKEQFVDSGIKVGKVHVERIAYVEIDGNKCPIACAQIKSLERRDFSVQFHSSPQEAIARGLKKEKYG